MTLRRVKPLVHPDIQPNVPDTAPPRVVEIDPAELLVDERYQRNLSERSRRLLRKIHADWDWRAFKPPVVVEVDGAMHVVDGQHTAIAAASHPLIETIPVLVVEAAGEEARAAAFVKHNRDRITVTQTQLHTALVEAGDEDALTIAQACERAGARVLKNPPANGAFAPGDTLAVSTLASVLGRRHAVGLRQVLDVCVGAKLAPISAAAIRAVENLLFSDEFGAEYAPDALAATLRAHLPDLEREAAAFAAQHKVPQWRGLAVAIGRKTRKKRGGR